MVMSKIEISKCLDTILFFIRNLKNSLELLNLISMFMASYETPNSTNTA